MPKPRWQVARFFIWSSNRSADSHKSRLSLKPMQATETRIPALKQTSILQTFPRSLRSFLLKDIERRESESVGVRRNFTRRR